MTGCSVGFAGFSICGDGSVGRRSFARSGWAALAAAAALAGVPAASHAQDPAPLTDTSAAAAAASFWSIFSESTPTLDLRTRVEYGDQNFRVPGVVNLEPSAAYTARARAGLRTGEYKGFQAGFEYEVNKQLGPKRFNAAGVEGPQDRTSIGDPESARFSQAYLKYSPASFVDFTVGRQKFVLGNGIWVGNNDFRNNGINYDALSTTIRPIENLELFYSYIYNVQTIFGSGADRTNDFDSRSNVFQATYTFADFFKLKGYGFLLDLERQSQDALSTNTYGLIATGQWTMPSTPLGPLRLDYNAEVATQTDAADSPRDYRASYVKGEVGVASPVGVRLGLGSQVFGHDNGVGFSNAIDPQIIRDVFLVNAPTNGLIGRYASIGGGLPFGFLAEVQYHKYRSRSGGDDYGQEVQVVAQRPINKRLSFLMRVDNYRNADPGPATNMFPQFPVDAFRYSLQLDFKLN
jgi:hypothetical protein